MRQRDLREVWRGIRRTFGVRMIGKAPTVTEELRALVATLDLSRPLGVRDRALLAHATQVDPEGPWFAVPLDVHQKAWPTEDYELARSLVEAEIPEDDLFAGLR